MWLRIVASSTLFARSCTLRLLFVPIVERAPARGGRYESDDDVIQSVEDFLREQDELFYQTGLSALKFTEIM